MKRITEPELMNQAEQVAAYAAADFEQAHQSVLNAFEQHFLGYELSGEVLDLGCGCGDISFRFGRRFPDCRVIGIDGSATMLAYAERIKAKSSDIQARIQFIEAIMPTNRIPVRNYTAIISNSFLHHLHSPEVLWRVIN